MIFLIIYFGRPYMRHAGLMNYFPAINFFYVEGPTNRHITRDVWILLRTKVVILSLFFSILMTHLSLTIVSFHWHL
jgi:hypothetical protein